MNRTMINKDYSEREQSYSVSLHQNQDQYFYNNNLSSVYYSDSQLASNQSDPRISNQDLNSTNNTQTGMRLNHFSPLQQEQLWNKIQVPLKILMTESKENKQLLLQLNGKVAESQQNKHLLLQLNDKVNVIIRHIWPQNEISSISSIGSYKYLLGSQQKLKSQKKIQAVFSNEFDRMQVLYPFKLFKHFDQKFKKCFQSDMIKMYNIYFDQLKMSQQQIILYLPYCYLLFCNCENYSEFVSKKGAVNIKHYTKINYQQSWNLYLVDKSMITKLNKYCSEYKDLYQGLGLFHTISCFIDQLGYEDFTKDQTIRSYLNRQIVDIFLGSKNLWSNPEQLFMAMILRLFKRTQIQEYRKLIKMFQELKSIDMPRTLQIMKALRSQQFFKDVK